MTNQDLIPAKATSPAEQSDAIVVSFRAEWHPHIRANDFTVVIRKQVPKLRPFQWLYFHVNAPVSAICARSPILNTFRATLQEALGFAPEVNLTPTQIKDYFWKAPLVGCYRLGPVEIAPKAVTTREIATTLIYRPPQSFVILSHRAKQIIDGLAQFSTANCT